MPECVLLFSSARCGGNYLQVSAVLSEAVYCSASLMNPLAIDTRELDHLFRIYAVFATGSYL